MNPDPDLSLADYRALAELRFEIRRFLHFSEQQARAAGIEPQQHQLMLAIKGLPEDRKPTIRELAGRLQLRHHSVVELIDRLEAHGAVLRNHCDQDRREVLIALTPEGEQLLRKLTIVHREELENFGPLLASSLRKVMRSGHRVESAAL